MPVYTLNVSAASPFIHYTGNWTFTAHEATFRDSSANTSLFVQANFSGSGMSMIGTASPTLFQLAPKVFLDSRIIQPQLDSALMVQAQPRFQGSGTHKVSCEITKARNYTIQNVVITTGDANPYTTSQEMKIQNTDLSNITYAGGPVHHSNKTSLTKIGHHAHANISFYGNDIAVYGAIMAGEPLPSYNISLDGQPSSIWPARENVTENIANVLLYQTSNLSTGSHFLSITPHTSESHPWLYLDHADVQQYINSTVARLSSAPSMPAPGPLSTVSSAAIAGGVVGGIIFLMTVTACVFFFLRRRSRRARLILGDEDGLNGGVHPFRSEDDMPPPDYQRVFPQAGIALLSRIERAWPRLGSTEGRDATRTLQLGLASPALLALTAATGKGTTQKSLRDHTTRPTLRNGNDASILAWNGRQPETIAVEKHLAILSHVEL